MEQGAYQKQDARFQKGHYPLFLRMGWEQRGANRYYYRNERDGSRVKSTYVGCGEMAHVISKLESSSAELEKLMRAKKTIEAIE